VLLVVGVLAAFFIGFVTDYRKEHWLPSFRWLQLAVFTAIVFGDLVRQFRRSWRQLTFWLCTGALLAAHIGIYAVLFIRVTEWRVIWFLPLSIAELVVLLWLFDALGYGHAGVVSPRKSRTAS